MKHFKFLSLLFMMMMGVCTFCACGDDDNDDGGGQNTGGLTGIWKRTYKYEVNYTKDSSGEWVKSGEKEKTYEDSRGSSGFLFQSNGIAKVLDDVMMDGTYELEEDDDFKYKVEGGHLYMWEQNPRDTDGFQDWGTIRISGDTFELQSEEIDGNRKEVSTKRYKKIK